MTMSTEAHTNPMKSTPIGCCPVMRPYIYGQQARRKSTQGRWKTGNIWWQISLRWSRHSCMRSRTTEGFYDTALNEASTGAVVEKERAVCPEGLCVKTMLYAFIAAPTGSRVNEARRGHLNEPLSSRLSMPYDLSNRHNNSPDEKKPADTQK